MVLFESINKLANPNGLAGGRRRHLFIPPLTQFPLFSYGDGVDQRSFISNVEHGSVLEEDEEEADVSDSASVLTLRSLPLTLGSSTTNEDQELFHGWLREEHARLHSRVHSIGSLNYGSIDPTDFSGLKTTYATEFTILLKYAVPLVITFVLEHFFSIVCLLVVGRLGTDELAAVSLGTMVTTVTFALFEGAATALDTLCPQAYGAGNFHLVGLYVQRCTAFSYTIFIPCAILWWFAPIYLRFIIDSERVLELTALFLRVMIAGAPGYIFFENGKRFLQAQGIFEAGSGILFLSAPVNIALSYMLVWNKRFGLGFVGAPIAAVLNFWLMSLLLVLYVRYIDGRRCWFGLVSLKELFLKWKRLLHLAIPGIIMLELEYLAYEIMTIVATYLGTNELVAQSTVGLVALLTYMVPFAVGIASLTRIANFIGGQNLHGAKVATTAGLLTGLAFASLNCIVLFTFKSEIASLFTKDEDVKALIVHLFNPLVSIIQIFDGLASVALGILRAQGQQKIGGLINFVSYYAFALPLALALCNLAGMRLIGLWAGIGCGMAVIAISETLVILCSDWELIMLRAGLMHEFDQDST